MSRKDIPFAEKCIEAKLSQLGAQIVEATEKSFAAKKLCEESNCLLLNAQSEIADLYESLEDVLAGQRDANEPIETETPDQSAPLAD